MTETDQSLELFCPQCGYNLTGIQSTRCPECGTSLDWAKLQEPKIPWVRRRELGRNRAFFRTAWLVIRRPGVIGKEVHRPVNRRDALQFRSEVVRRALLAVWAAVLGAQLTWGLEPRGLISLDPSWRLTSTMPPTIDLAVCYYAGMTLWPMPWIGALACVIAWTGAASYFFDSPSLSPIKRERAVSLSYYASAPLALLLVPMVFFGVMFALYALGAIDESTPLTLDVQIIIACAWGSLGLVILLLYGGALGVLRRAGDGMGLRTFAAAMGLPAVWLLVAVLFFGIVPALCGFLRMVFYSYWS